MKLPQLSLRELFLIVVIAAMGCGWWVERQRLRKERRLYEWRADLFQYVMEEDGWDFRADESAEAGIVILDPSGKRRS